MFSFPVLSLLLARHNHSICSLGLVNTGWYYLDFHIANHDFNLLCNWICTSNESLNSVYQSYLFFRPFQSVYFWSGNSFRFNWWYEDAQLIAYFWRWSFSSFSINNINRVWICSSKSLLTFSLEIPDNYFWQSYHFYFFIQKSFALFWIEQWRSWSLLVQTAVAFDFLH